MALIDVGVNLTAASLHKRAAEVITNASAVGVTRNVIIGTSIDVSAVAVQLAEQLPGCIATAGVHPHDAKSVSAEFIEQLRSLAQHPQVRAIGECGLDYNRNFSPPDVQRKVFAAQLELAAELGMPVYLHERDAIGDQLAILDQYIAQLPAVIVHCFTGDKTALAAYQERDCYIGITGWVCDERRGFDLQQAVPHIHDNRLLLETDSPYLMPRTIRPKPKSGTNTPTNLPWVLAKVAELRNQTPEELTALTTTNAIRVFSAWPEAIT